MINKVSEKKISALVVDQLIISTTNVVIVFLIGTLNGVKEVGEYAIYMTMVMAYQIFFIPTVQLELSIKKNVSKSFLGNALIASVIGAIMIYIIIEILDTYIFEYEWYAIFTQAIYLVSRQFYLSVKKYIKLLLLDISNIFIVLSYILYTYLSGEILDYNLMFMLGWGASLLFVYIEKPEIWINKNRLFRIKSIFKKNSTLFINQVIAYLKNALIIFVIANSITIEALGVWRILQSIYGGISMLLISLDSFVPQTIRNYDKKETVNFLLKITIAIASITFVYNETIIILLENIDFEINKEGVLLNFLNIHLWMQLLIVINTVILLYIKVRGPHKLILMSTVLDMILIVPIFVIAIGLTDIYYVYFYYIVSLLTSISIYLVNLLEYKWGGK